MSDDKKKGTLSIGGTLSANRSGSTSRGSGVAVEVRRRRFGPAANTQTQQAEAPVDSELARRKQILEEAKKREAEENARREQEKLQAQDLIAERSKKHEELGRQRQEREDAERRREAEEAARKAEAELAAAQAQNQEQRRVVPQEKRKTLTVDKDNENRGRGKGEGGGKRGRNAYMDELEQRYRTMPSRRKERRMGGGGSASAEKVIRTVAIPETITVQELAKEMAEKGGEVVKRLMQMGQMVTLTQSVDQDTAALIVEEFGHKYTLVTSDQVEEQVAVMENDAANMVERPPVVTVMGHVDHGKTSLLDALRQTRVAEGEAGGITQHIGAYQIKTKSGKPVTFLDTPGHEAFTTMRARGAQVTDVVILVVAADDSVMPQTIEAIQHAKAAGVPIVVAINKMDKPEATPDRVKQDLLKHDLVVEDFGGDVVSVPVSAKTGMGLDDLLEMVLLQTDVLELQADPKRRADGVIVESRLDKGRGPVATVIVRGGTVRKGDIVVAGPVWGRVRALIDDSGKIVKEAGPSFPVEILGLSGVPEAGDVFTVAENDRQAKEVAEWRANKRREQDHAAKRQALSLDNLFNRIAAEGVQDLPIVVKADVQGSVEAIREALEKLTTEQVKVRVLHSAVGVVTESDVMLATASGALIIGFNVRADATARRAADSEGVEIRYYSVIYNLIDDVKAALSGMLSPDEIEEVLGQIEVRALFKIGKVRIAGCYVTEGKAERNAKARLIRDGKVIADTTIATLRREKNDAKEVASGYECGLTLENYDDFQEGDIVEVYTMKEVAKDFDDVQKAEEKAAKEKAEADELAALEAEMATDEAANS
jgi:translation initiation factor IF-2